MRLFEISLKIFLVLLVSYSCETNENNKTISKNTKTCEFFAKVSDSLNSMYCKTYYETGELRSEGEYINDIPVYWHKFYRKSGLLETEIDYIWFPSDQKSEINQRICYSENGDTIKEQSNYFDVLVDKDTVTLGEEFIAEIILTCPYWKNSKVEFIFKIPHDSKNNRHIYTGSNYCTYNYRPKDTGTYNLSFRIEEILFELDSLLPDTMQFIEVRKMYFDHEYYVKK